MKYIIFAIMFLACNAWALSPATITITNLRDEAEADASSVEYVRGYQLVFTNCVAYSGTSTSSAKEDLTGLTVTLTLGWPYSNIVYTATAQVATAGTWSCATTVPTNWTTTKIQVKLSGTTSTNIYPLKILNTREAIK
ncbi:MAG: hypothetical protein L6455_14605 [Kiritimatiellae bacterium]|nr:hypothetical protein [Kiritimatiellia bacterium]